MARKDTINQVNVQNLKDKSSMITYGMDSTLDNEANEVHNIIRQTIIDTKQKLGERTNGKPINYFNELNFGNAFSQLFINKDDKNKSDPSLKDINNFKEYMTNNNQVDINSLLAENSTRTMLFNNYRIIHQHIPECASALKIYKDNIMSPDDYTKLIFNIEYTKATNAEAKTAIEARLDKISEKYQLEDKADKIIDETLLLGESYFAVLSIEDELQTMLSDPINSNGVLNESMVRTLDKDVVSNTVLTENINLNENDIALINEAFGTSEKHLGLKESQELIGNLINQNVVIGSSKELLLERYEAEEDKKKNLNDIPDEFYNKKSNKKKKNFDSKPMFLNGSSLRRLDPERVVELKIDDICYGYYYAEDAGNLLPQSSMFGFTSGREITGSLNLAQNNTINSTTSSTYTPANSVASQFQIGEQKLRLITDMFINVLSKKVDKDFIRRNKEFKDFIYDLVRQDYIIKKGLKLTYFKPDEVIKFECDPVYKDITFFAKLYLSILTNNLLIKLGRAHDKRVFYISTGQDAQYAQSIQSVIQDIKTKDYKMESLNDFNTILNLNPGRFDDYFMPTINGERPVEIETLAGMDVDMNNDFVEYLKNSMMSGMDVPRNLIDVSSEVDYARSISASNANFVRSVVRYQKRLTPAFTRLYQMLYRNEYKYVNDSLNTEEVDITSIKVKFPSPATLAYTNLLEQIQSVDSLTDFISNQMVIPKTDGSSEEERLRFKAALVRKYLPSLEWDEFDDMLEVVRRDAAKEITKNKDKVNNNLDAGLDPYGGQY